MPIKSKNIEALTLSIIIPVYNEENYISVCLDAIALQTVMPDEVIVVDNNSSDRTKKIARKYDFVTVLSEAEQGIVYARNTGFNKASSEIIGRIDADTQLGPDWVETVKCLAVNMPPNQAYTGPCTFRNWRGKMMLYWGHRIVYFWSSYLFLGHHTLFGSNMFMKNELWQTHRTSICLRNDVHEDMDLSIHIKRAGGSIGFSNKMKATISPRRIFMMSHYPLMWLKTQLVHFRFRIH